VSSLRELIKETADRVIAEGANPVDVRGEVLRVHGIGIGGGGGGTDPAVKLCPYCGAYGGGGHGGFCPNGS